MGSDGSQLGVMSPQEGLKVAEGEGLDLVEVAPTAKPPVCRIMDYSRFKYEQEKREREAKKKQKVTHVKELKFTPKISEHDYQVKFRHMEEFLKRGDKVKATMTFRGREMAHMDIGRRLLERISKEVSAYAEVEAIPKKFGRSLVMVIAPKRK